MTGSYRAEKPRNFDESVKVIVRCRPLVEREKNEQSSVQIDKEERQIYLDRGGKNDYKSFRFDEVFD